MMLLGELPMLKGRKEVFGTVGYVPQESWLLPDTVRRNIIFDKKYDEEKYLQVLQACSLNEVSINSYCYPYKHQEHLIFLHSLWFGI